jgi:hypothetical protein
VELSPKHALNFLWVGSAAFSVSDFVHSLILSCLFSLRLCPLADLKDSGNEADEYGQQHGPPGKYHRPLTKVYVKYYQYQYKHLCIA